MGLSTECGAAKSRNGTKESRSQLGDQQMALFEIVGKELIVLDLVTLEQRLSDVSGHVPPEGPGIHHTPA